jgi:hypothetical protein
MPTPGVQYGILQHMVSSTGIAAEVQWSWAASCVHCTAVGRLNGRLGHTASSPAPLDLRR